MQIFCFYQAGPEYLNKFCSNGLPQIVNGAAVSLSKLDEDLRYCRCRAFANHVRKTRVASQRCSDDTSYLFVEGIAMTNVEYKRVASLRKIPWKVEVDGVWSRLS